MGGSVGCALPPVLRGVRSSCDSHPRQLPQLATVDIDLCLLTFGFVISVLSSLVFGTLPGWLGLRVKSVGRVQGRWAPSYVDEPKKIWPSICGQRNGPHPCGIHQSRTFNSKLGAFCRSSSRVFASKTTLLRTHLFSARSPLSHRPPTHNSTFVMNMRHGCASCLA